MEGHTEPPPLPDLGPLEFYATLFAKMGRIKNNGMGLEAMPISEVEAFGRVECLDLEDVRTLRAMSVAYMNAYRAGDDALRLPPWDGKSLWPM